MNKTLATLVAVLAITGASVASAQTYYTYAPLSTSCTLISSDMSVGSKGSDVRALQNFLVSQNYPGGGSWMVTGTYGQATEAAVRNFQQLHGLPITGRVDGVTRSAINGTNGCVPTSTYNYSAYSTNYSYAYPFSYSYTSPGYNYNYNSNNYTYPYSYSYPYNYNNSYNYNYNYNSCGTFPYYYPCNTYSTSVTLSSLSPMSGVPGTTVTVFGQGFDRVNNTVYVGGTTLTGISSYDGQTLQFTIPSGMAYGPVSISVATPLASAVSNKLTFTIGNYGWNNYSYNPYTASNTYGCGYGYIYQYCPTQNGPIGISYLSPMSGAVGTSVTVYGWGFSTDNNTVHFSNGIIAGLRSIDGRSLSFTIPAQLAGYGYQPIGLGTYNVSVTNSSGATSNTLPFTITSVSSSGALGISNITGPTNLAVGQNGTWNFTVTGQSGTTISASVRWGDENQYGYTVSAPQSFYSNGSNVFTFSHAYQTIGNYTVVFTVQNGYGQQNTASVTVNVSGTSGTGSVTLYSAYPTIVARGQQIQLYGSGFTSDNTVHFASGGSLHVPSQNGSYLMFTVPFWTSPCDLLGYGYNCGAPTTQVTPGTYPIYVTNAYGTSQTINVQVQ